MNNFLFVIVGAGYAGSVTARCLADNYPNDSILLIESKNHIGGHSHDRYNEHGILIHEYGPHIFHTNSKKVFDFLSRFTTWRDYQHRVLASIDGRLLPIPINRDTINKYFGLNLSNQEVAGFLEKIAEKKDVIKNSEDAVVSKIGRELFENSLSFILLSNGTKSHLS